MLTSLPWQSHSKFQTVIVIALWELGYRHYHFTLLRFHLGWPGGMAEWIERPSPVLVDCGIRTLVESNQWFKNLYLSLPSQALSIIRIGQGLVGSVRIMWLTGIYGHGADCLVSQSGSTMKSWVCSVTLMMSTSHPDMTLDIARTQNPNNQPIPLECPDLTQFKLNFSPHPGMTLDTIRK